MTTEGFVERFLVSLGVAVHPITIGPQKTPDFLVSDTASTYLVEVKEKYPNPEVEGQRIESLARTGIWEEESSLGFQNSISSVVREACEQLAAFQPQVAHFRLIWLHARGRYPDDKLEQFRATLIGVADLIDTAEIGESVTARPCYYFRESAFFRHRNVLDGAFVSTDEKVQLILNTMSPRYELLERSGLCRSFPAVCDPGQGEAEGNRYIADCSCDRSDSRAVLDYVKAKYGRPGLIEFAPKRYSAETIMNHR
jgi:hypothetical protein